MTGGQTAGTDGEGEDGNKCEGWGGGDGGIGRRDRMKEEGQRKHTTKLYGFGEIAEVVMGKG
jgi:hypothetical protein